MSAATEQGVEGSRVGVAGSALIGVEVFVSQAAKELANGRRMWVSKSILPEFEIHLTTRGGQRASRAGDDLVFEPIDVELDARRRREMELIHQVVQAEREHRLHQCRRE